MTHGTVALAAALALAACVPALRAEHALVGPPRPPSTATVRVVMDGAPVPAGAQEIAIVSATGSPAGGLPAIMGALQAEAASVGANAVVRVRYDVGATSATATGVAVWID
jgi:hypothetical protein